MNSLPLRLRLLLLILLPSTACAVSLIAYFTYTAINSLEVELIAKGVATVRYLAPVSEYGILAGQIDALHGLTQAVNQDSGIKAAVIVNTNGQPLAVSGHLSLAAQQLRQIPESPQKLGESGQRIAFSAPVWRSLDETDPLFDAPKTEKNATREKVGGIFIEFDKGELSKQKQQLLFEGLMIMLVGLGVLAVIAISVAGAVVRPLMRLVEAVGSISGGKLDTRVVEESDGEIRILEKGFNEMAEHLQQARQSMVERIEEATAHLAYQARHDPLTGLVNRREFELRLGKALAAVEAGSDQCSLLFVSIDRFTQINDACGYLAGDELLRQMALMLQGRLRGEDLLARADGAAFTILLSNSSSTRARQVADDICSLTSAYRFIWEDEIFLIEISVGIANIARDAANIGTVMADADAACRAARESGRNRSSEKSSGGNELRPYSGSWAKLIADGLAEQRLQVEALPLLALKKGLPNIHHVELTARMSLPGQPPIALPALLDAAERYNLAEHVDQQLIDVAIEALARARQENRRLCCLIPISRTALSKRSMLAYVASKLGGLGLSSAKGLCFLIPEDLLTHTTSQALGFANEIRSLGGQIGLDDFGGGLSSFAHLRTVMPAYVKISPSLTRDSRTSRSSMALLRAISEITAEQNIYSIAEGINTQEALEDIRALDINFAEGKAIGPREPFDVWFEGAVMRGAWNFSGQTQ